MRSYIGVQGVAAGPIRVGPEGAWIVNSSQLVSGTTSVPVLSIQKTPETSATSETVFVPMRAGLASTDDPNGVVTFEFLQHYYPDHEVPSIDLSAYTTIAQFNRLYAAVLGTNTSYTNANCIEVRVSALENEVQASKNNNNQLDNKIQSLSTQVYANATGIKNLQTQLDNINVTPFIGETLLIAGGAGSVEVSA